VWKLQTAAKRLRFSRRQIRPCAVMRPVSLLRCPSASIVYRCASMCVFVCVRVRICNVSVCLSVCLSLCTHTLTLSNAHTHKLTDGRHAALHQQALHVSSSSYDMYPPPHMTCILLLICRRETRCTTSTSATISIPTGCNSGMRMVLKKSNLILSGVYAHVHSYVMHACVSE
jgi:hypothetical protein